MHIFHQWGKWEEDDRTVIVKANILLRLEMQLPYSFTDKGRKRTCSVCGKTQREEVKPS